MISPHHFTHSAHSASDDKFPAVTAISDYYWSDSLCGCCRCYSCLQQSCRLRLPLPNGRMCVSSAFNNSLKTWDAYAAEPIANWEGNIDNKRIVSSFPYVSTINSISSVIGRFDAPTTKSLRDPHIIGTFHNVDRIYIQNCIFYNINASKEICDIVFQYGGLLSDTDSDISEIYK